MSKLEDINILTEWDLTTRTHNALKDNGILKLSELLEWPEKKFLTIPGFGKKGLEEIKNYLDHYNLKLGMKFELVEYDQRHFLKIDDFKNLKEAESNLDYEILSIKILEEWPISVRTFNSLKKENINLLGDLISYGIENLMDTKNFGEKSYREIINLIKINDIDLDKIYFDPKKWEDFKRIKGFDIQNNNVENNLNDNRKFNKPISIKKSILRDYEQFKKEYFNTDKIYIEKDVDKSKIESLIIDDIEHIISILNDRIIIIFKGRYGYKESYKTLQELGNKHKITRERIRQLENYLNQSLSKLGKINKETLVNYFNQYEFISFHKLFPTLDMYFSNTARGTEEITGDKLTTFMENYCGVEKGYFKTPERELWNFDITKLEEIFKIVPSGIEKEKFLELIEENYGYNKFVSLAALEFMEAKKLIKIENQKIYIIKLNRIAEVCNILLKYPDGLHWKKICEIGNQSYSKNKWNPVRHVADYSMNMIHNKDIYLSERGTIKLFKFCPEIENSDEIVDFFINYLKLKNKNEIAMETVYKEIVKINKFKNLNFYDARAIIKKFGGEKGIYHSGPSGTNTISFDKNVKRISLKDKIIEIINNSSAEIHVNEIKKQLQKTNEDLPLETHLNTLVDEMLIFRISPGTYLNFNEGINLSNKTEIHKFLDDLLERYEFVTSSFVREKINDNLGYGQSNFYYDSLSRLLAKENKWYYGSNYLSKKLEKQMNIDQYVKINYDENLSTNENFDNLSRKIGISKTYFNNIIYQMKDNFNTDWVHQND